MFRGWCKQDRRHSPSFDGRVVRCDAMRNKVFLALFFLLVMTMGWYICASMWRSGISPAGPDKGRPISNQRSGSNRNSALECQGPSTDPRGMSVGNRAQPEALQPPMPSDLPAGDYVVNAATGAVRHSPPSDPAESMDSKGAGVPAADVEISPATGASIVRTARSTPTASQPDGDVAINAATGAARRPQLSQPVESKDVRGSSIPAVGIETNPVTGSPYVHATRSSPAAPAETKKTAAKK